MKLNRWTRPGSSEVRYYVDMRFGGSPYAGRSMNRILCGYWLQADNKGNTVAYTRGIHGQVCRGEDGKFVLDFFGAVDLPFAKFEERFNASLTKGGNFSEHRYFKTEWPDWKSNERI